MQSAAVSASASENAATEDLEKRLEHQSMKLQQFIDPQTSWYSSNAPEEEHVAPPVGEQEKGQAEEVDDFKKNLP